ncbi:YciE/YciF ferroxidase family protein [Pedobacter deserti]|uniref:YciE/YciF ferroxidase family protein n=1 Tax=Pedobacter deserti TaxID=2817382 RepID=UPI00210EA1AF|nr:ferritin-like domain-containing protein [Pedobacter sp. SYSU D00382]
MKAKSGSEPKFSTKTNPAAEPALKELFVDSIKDLYWAENHLVKTLPKMQKSATSSELAGAIGKHLTETETHVKRLEQVFDLLGEKPQAKKCDAMEGLAKEGESIIESTEAGTATRDVGIILASQKVEHYEIASYGGLVQLAATLGLSEVAEVLTQTLEEEKNADLNLTEIAEKNINYKAAEEA